MTKYYVCCDQFSLTLGTIWYFYLTFHIMIIYDDAVADGGVVNWVASHPF